MKADSKVAQLANERRIVMVRGLGDGDGGEGERGRCSGGGGVW